MDELKIWDRSLTADEVQDVIYKKLDGSETGLVGYWDFDESEGSTVFDHSKNHFNGVIKGNAQRELSEVPLD